MKILAFCGGASNSNNFRMQILPIVHNLEQDGTAQFHFVQGIHRVPPPRGYEEYFGPPPHYSFYTNCSVEDLERRGFSQDSEEIGDTPEETLRNLSSSDTAEFNKEGYIQDLDWLNKLLDSEGPFDAVLGFSLGACIAATLLDDNIRRSKDKGVPSMFKMGIFLCGCPPFDLRDSGSGLLLADTAGQVFQLPTVHLIGSADPLIDFALALYNLCDPDTAEIFDHGRGHQLIWEKIIVGDLCNLLRQKIHEVSPRPVPGAKPAGAERLGGCRPTA